MNDEPNKDLSVPAVTGDTDLTDLFLATLEKAIALPGVKIGRTPFLMDAYKLSGTEAENVDAFSVITLDQMDKAASSVIATNVTTSSATAFALGLPGGFAMAATIPTDIMQNFAFSLRLAQQLAYCYGFDDLFTTDSGISEDSQNKLIAFLGVMFAVNGSGLVLRHIAPNIGKYAAKQLMKAPLTKGVWYPMLKKISGVVAQKTVTKKGLSQFATKAIPIVGGGISAAVNVATMLPMANRLKNELRKYYLPDEEIQELEAKEQVSFSEMASDAASDVAAGVINAVWGFGQGVGRFAEAVVDKTKSKLADVSPSDTKREILESQDGTSECIDN